MSNERNELGMREECYFEEIKKAKTSKIGPFLKKK